MENMIIQISAAVQATAAVAIVLLAIGTLRLNRALARDNRRLMKAELEPQVVAYISQEERDGELPVCLNVENIGRGPARNVIGRVEAPRQDDEYSKFEFWRILKDNHAETLDIKFLPQGARAHVGLLNRRLEGIMTVPPPFKVGVAYENLCGEVFEDNYDLDVKHVSPKWTVERV